MIYLLWGKDEFNIQARLEKIISEYPEARVVNLTETDLDDVINEVLTDSFFDNQRLILTQNLLKEKYTKKEEQSLISALERRSSQTIVVFVESNEPKAELKKYLGNKAKIHHYEKPQGKDLVNHIKALSQKYEADISPLAAERLASYVGPDYWQLDEEVKKLALYKRGDDLEDTIEVADVDELVRAGFEANIFEFMDAISQKNVSRSIMLLDSFLDSGQNEIYILTMIARQFRNIAMAKLDNPSEAALAKSAGVHPYVAKKSIIQARNFTAREILDIYGRITEADLALKSGLDSKQALGMIILK